MPEPLDDRLAVRRAAQVAAELSASAAQIEREGVDRGLLDRLADGQGMDLAEPAQRLLRAAAFQIVHSQAAHVRTATLAALVA